MERKGKKWTNAKKVIIDGITFDSTMEGEMYKLLKRAKVKFKYIGSERAKYTVLEEDEYKGGCYERAQKRSKELKDTPKITKAGYTPDFCGENEEWFIEVKGRKLGDFNLKWKLFKKMLMKRKPQPILFMPVTKQDCENVITILKSKGYARK
jgi:hypothetical protein